MINNFKYFSINLYCPLLNIRIFSQIQSSGLSRFAVSRKTKQNITRKRLKDTMHLLLPCTPNTLSNVYSFLRKNAVIHSII